MAQFQELLGSGGSRIAKYERYLQETEYVKDIRECIDYNSQSIENSINRASEMNLISSNQINQSLKNVCGTIKSGFDNLSHTLENGFEGVNTELRNISSEISSLSSLMSWGFSSVVHQLQITNRLLGQVVDILKIPDSQKERVYYIEEGLKHLKNGLMNSYDSDFFDYAVEKFNLALGKEKYDYITLYQLGYICLHSKKYLNPQKSEAYFRNAAKFAFAEYNVGGTHTTNTLNPFESSFNLQQNISLVASAEALLYAARACFLQDKTEEAIELSSKAYQLIPHFLVAGFDQAKYLCINSTPNLAVPILSELIQKDRFQILKIMGDVDIIFHEEIMNFLNELSLKTIEYAKRRYKEISKGLVSNSLALSLLNSAETYINRHSFLDAMTALDILEGKYFWQYNIFSYDEKNNALLTNYAFLPTYFERVYFKIEYRNNQTAYRQAQNGFYTQNVLLSEKDKTEFRIANLCTIQDFLKLEREAFLKKKAIENTIQEVKRNAEMQAAIKAKRENIKAAYTLLLAIFPIIAAIYACTFTRWYFIAAIVFLPIIGFIIGLMISAVVGEMHEKSINEKNVHDNDEGYIIGKSVKKYSFHIAILTLLFILICFVVKVSNWRNDYYENTKYDGIYKINNVMSDVAHIRMKEKDNFTVSFWARPSNDPVPSWKFTKSKDFPDRFYWSENGSYYISFPKYDRGKWLSGEKFLVGPNCYIYFSSDREVMTLTNTNTEIRAYRE